MQCKEKGFFVPVVVEQKNDFTDAVVCVLALPEIKEYRRQGYEVEIVERDLPDAPRRLVDVVS